MIKISLLGSCGSIGAQVLNVVRRHSDKFKIVGLCSNKNDAMLVSQIKEFKPEYACLSDESAGNLIKGKIPQGTVFECGKDTIKTASQLEVADIIFVAVSGFVGLDGVVSAIKAKKRIAIANKEVLVAGGAIVTKLAKEYGVELIPVDSEHSAIFQALSYDREKPFKKLIITASGGPFWRLSSQEILNVTKKDALNHPNWKMGQKITIDSATLMNKGLEVIEAMWLYNCGLEKIEAIIHPESIIHSMVEFADGSVMAQMSYPTMEIPITLALTYPNRIDVGVKSLDFYKIKNLSFYQIDKEKFPCFDIALKCAGLGENFPCAMNAINEEAVGMFLQDKIKFCEIPVLIKRVLDKISLCKVVDLDYLKEIDKEARILTLQQKMG